MSKTPNFDLKIKSVLDVTKPGERVCSVTGEKWEMTEEEIGWYKKFDVPPDDMAPLTRMRQQTAFFVGYEWWYNTDDKTGKQIISFIHPSSKIKVMTDKEWFAEDFSSTSIEYDSGKPFFEQLDGLYKSIPVNSLRNLIEPTNSIASASFGDVGSYFVLASETKNSLYSSDSVCEDSCEIFASGDVHNSYSIGMSKRIHNCQFVRDSYECLNSSFLFHCGNCEYCFGATNKKNKKYLWWDEQLSKEEWEKRFAEVDFSCRSKLDEYKQQYHDLVANAVWPENFNNRVTNCTGEYLFDSVNMSNCYLGVGNSQDQYWTAYSYLNSRDCAFTTVFSNCNDMYRTWLATKSANCKFCLAVTQCDGLEYSINCYNCTNCFGCVGLQRKQFCIFNKQYAEDDYWKKLDEIKCTMLEKGEYGKFYPLFMSHCYVLTSGSVLVYLSEKKDLEKLGATFFEPESNGAVGKELEDTSKMRQAKDVPDCIDDFTDDWLNIPIYDEAVKRRFAYIKPEIEFYKRMKIAPPNNHFTERVKDLFRQSNSGVFEETTCAKCKKKIQVARNKVFTNRKIYCKPCYYQYLEEYG